MVNLNFLADFQPTKHHLYRLEEIHLIWISIYSSVVKCNHFIDKTDKKWMKKWLQNKELNKSRDKIWLYLPLGFSRRIYISAIEAINYYRTNNVVQKNIFVLFKREY